MPEVLTREGAVGWIPVVAKARAPWWSSCPNAPAGEILQCTIARPSALSESTAWRGHAMRRVEAGAIMAQWPQASPWE